MKRRFAPMYGYTIRLRFKSRGTPSKPTRSWTMRKRSCASVTGTVEKTRIMLCTKRRKAQHNFEDLRTRRTIRSKEKHNEESHAHRIVDDRCSRYHCCSIMRTSFRSHG